MAWLLRVGTSLTIGLILTLVSAVGSLLWTMFTTQPGDSRALSFFGALFFEAKHNLDGGLTIGLGLENAVPLVVGFCVFSCFSLVVSIVVTKLRAYKRTLTPRPGD